MVVSSPVCDHRPEPLFLEVSRLSETSPDTASAEFSFFTPERSRHGSIGGSVSPGKREISKKNPGSGEGPGKEVRIELSSIICT